MASIFSMNLVNKEKNIRVIFSASFSFGDAYSETQDKVTRRVQVQDDNAAFRTVNMELDSELTLLNRIKELLEKGYEYEKVE